MAANMATIFGDGIGLQQTSSPIYLTFLSTEGKIVSKYSSISKTVGKGSFNSS